MSLLIPGCRSLPRVCMNRTQDTAEMREQQKESQSGSSDPVPKAVTLIVTEAQAEKLIQAEYTGKLHLIFEKRMYGCRCPACCFRGLDVFYGRFCF
ncbi:RcpC/CpaB family pilus assembly protein [Paenibacillus sp. BR2-3]|uniref:RcpC/CpaB family pilus assembly protein n=1 Tax=Paenibacillus sp. BR2-3 TaxID=3048494 RepID=UPI003977794E